MDKVIIIRIGEIYLKGKNRSFFENLLISNIKNKLSGLNCKCFFGRNRYIVSEFAESEASGIIALLKTVFGIHSLSTGYKTATDMKNIVRLCLLITPKSGTFRVTVNRADKSFPLNSVALACELGGRILDEKPQLSVDLHDPDFTVNVDIREDGKSYVFGDKIPGAGGMPVGSAGKGMLLLSGGIDSPVAGYMMAKRGLSIQALHFYSYPYTSDAAKEKVVSLAKIMQNYCSHISFMCVPLTQIQEAINKYCNNNYLITILRRFMMKIAEKIALDRGCGCIINGESLGQVASQTLQSITVTNAVVNELPVFRPLIGMDKQEIIEIAEKIGTYETSILPYEDCCTVFLPESPVTRPTIEHCLEEEAKIPDYDKLLDFALSNIEFIKI